MAQRDVSAQVAAGAAYRAACEAGVATGCDQCGRDIVYGETCYAVPDGSTLDGLPVVRLLCGGCYTD